MTRRAVPLVTRAVRDLLPGGPVPSAARAALYAAAIWMAIAMARPSFLPAGTPVFESDHAAVSMEIAMARAYCDSPSKISPRVRLPHELRERPDLLDRPIRSLVTERTGGMREYCLSVGSPIVNNENGLMWLESWVLFLRPDLSFRGLGETLHRLRLAGLAFCSWAFLVLGGGIVLTGIATGTALLLLQQMQPQVFTNYPFMFVLILVTASLYALASKWRLARTVPRAGALALGAGTWTAFAVNMRTSHLPVYLAMAVIFLVLDHRVAGPAAAGPRAVAARAVAALLSFTLAYGAFEYVSITRHLPVEIAGSAQHSIAHPIVLGLGVPESDLSRREGITWSDAAAWTAARRIDPNVPYLGPVYQRVLFSYYFGLWRDRPREMLGVYRHKAEVAGKQMLAVLRGGGGSDGRVLRWLLAPLDLLPNGLLILGVYLAAAAIAAWRAWSGNLAAQLMTYLAVAAVLLHVESALIMSTYVVIYHAYLAFYAVFLSAALSCGSMAALWPGAAHPCAGRR